MGTGVLSKVSVAGSNIDHKVKSLMFKQLEVDTVTALGTTQATGVALVAGKNMVLAADGSVGVVLPPAKEGMVVEVVNTVSTQTLKVYAAVDEQINAISTASAYSLTAGGAATFHCDALAHWYVAVSNATGTATSASTAELDVLDGALDTNLVAAKAAILGTGGALTLGGALTAVTSIGIGNAVLSEAEMEMLDGITGGTQLASKAIVNDANVNQGIAKVTQLHIGSTGAETQVNATGAELNAAADLSAQVMTTGAGAGFTDGVGAVAKSSVVPAGTIKTATILLDLTGTASSTTDLDIIGSGASPAYIGRVLAAEVGTVLTVQMTCLEAPDGGVTDIDLYSCTEGTGVFDQDFSALTETALLTSGGAWTNGAVKAATVVPAANQYLYLTCGAAGTAATYTAGKFLIEVTGY